MKLIRYLLFILSISVSAQYSIGGSFNPVEEYPRVFLYKATPTGANYIAQGTVDKDGAFSIILDTTATQGIYKLVYAVPPEENNFDIIYNAKEDVVLHFNKEKGVEYENSQENKLWYSYLKSMSLINSSIQNFYTQKSKDVEAFKQLFTTLKNTQETYEKEAEGKMVSVFIKANRSYIPEKYENLTTYVSNVLANYFTPIDFGNEWLQSSDYLTEKVFAFVFDVLPNADNTFYKKQLNALNNAVSNSHLNYKTSLLSLLWQEFVSMENDEIANFIADEFLKQLAKKSYNQDLLIGITNFQKIAIGVQANNFTITEKQTLYDLTTSEKYLLIFWSTSCGHCLDELPLVHNYLSSVSKEKLTVIAFGLEDTDAEWKEEIKQFPNFTHVIGLEKWDNQVANDYNINATPSYFLLDTDKNIMAKPYDFEALKKVITKN